MLVDVQTLPGEDHGRRGRLLDDRRAFEEPRRLEPIPFVDPALVAPKLVEVHVTPPVGALSARPFAASRRSAGFDTVANPARRKLTNSIGDGWRKV